MPTAADYRHDRRVVVRAAVLLTLVLAAAVVVAGCGDVDATTDATYRRTYVSSTPRRTIPPVRTTTRPADDWTVDVLAAMDELADLSAQMESAANDVDVDRLTDLCYDAWIAVDDWQLAADAVPIADVRAPLVAALDYYEMGFGACVEGDLAASGDYIRQAGDALDDATAAVNGYR